MTPFKEQLQPAPQNRGTNDRQRPRPDLLRWIWYAFGGALGPRYRQWVLHFGCVPWNPRRHSGNCRW